ncbi:hypothetical protein [Candidatus Manganitrophus noduliformans]|uniref:Uncharacterized protein n=1 Tax=Candidatus Manganitrophus noduliformans TaxID=2606439 RepID=A0A7X6DTK8_9BACT|nr:hypothetical protein [Candidatus Manganitrophus noduliformans]NKE72798.1 hypothetical protein [Candidatus Manganitrophus noduliformans]
MKKNWTDAYRRECSAIANELKALAAKISGPEDLWRIHDDLTNKRVEIDQMYDYRYSVLVTVFAGLLREGWITEEDLKGLAAEKIEKIKAISSW